MDNVKRIWNEWSETWYQRYRTDKAIAKIIQNPESAFHRTTFSMIKAALPDLKGKKVLVPSSGDNLAVFALHMMGAKVTSCDISEKQIEHSSNLAGKYGWDIEFICDDTMRLSSVKSDEYDFVYTSNGVHVWIADLNSMYSSIRRILKKGGAYIMFDIHPFLRPFELDKGKLTLVKPYDAAGPFLIDEVPRLHWRMQDIVNAIISSGLSVKHIEEMFAEDGSFWVDESTSEGDSLSAQELEDLRNWKLNSMAGLPQWVSIHAVK
ncbi:class I SAM-dependent methyltransferase [Paenibacillus doosanensis]|uniref:class I SAM-dependent methyltransferase n=1 Tax=Paenibacillus doosanensis TaxID=1229154 RepID=UPI0021803114|nr:class I SAM-dependent methyltransferase [Paenibacillus doosanensis]MCS7459414.1 class I SAM-dependent methyltransferase [Paenibacillus doosanensis]